ncbi:hypothetical protein BGZ95_000418 [Linnemannia exigua]|uniref:Uncharacterized protein n=1 Tax=Linnemannia exigua TaxID=604196 RepID=A0AAD4D8B9_9FUNG|nr:hypothetical protein BGZ95_000418 [Linnemannia exigua]
MLPSKEHPAPAISIQYVLKPWKEPPEALSLPEPTKKQSIAAIKSEIGKDKHFGPKEIMDALKFEHPTVALDLDRLSSHVHAAVEFDLIAKLITECIRGSLFEEELDDADTFPFLAIACRVRVAFR